MSTLPEQFHSILEAAVMVAGKPVTPADLQKLFDEDKQPSVKDIRDALAVIQQHYIGRGITLTEVASGFQFQANPELSPWLGRLWEERAPRFSRAYLETIALIAYRQPITRAEIEEIRGVAVSSNIVKTLQEREWVRVIGYKDVPGKPALYGTTKTFLDHLNLKSLDELPTLSELIDLESQEEKLHIQLELGQHLENDAATEHSEELFADDLIEETEDTLNDISLESTEAHEALKTTEDEI